MDKPDLYVVARFLDIMHRNGSPMKRTNIQMSLGVNYPRFTEYLDWLLAHGLVNEVFDEEERGAGRIALAPKGIEAHQRLVEWIKDTIEDVKL